MWRRWRRVIKAMDYKDYYKVLGVPRDADDQTIKSAFRKLARKYHPDLAKDDPQAEAHFKEVNEAYQVLGDKDKRAKYDQLGSSYQAWQQGGGMPGGFDWSQWASGPGMRVDYSGSASDLFSDFFQQIFGAGPAGAGAAGMEDLFAGMGGRPRSSAGRDLETSVEISLEEAYHGTTRIITAAGRNLQVKIPAGSATGTRVRVPGKGATSRSGAPGDLFLRVQVQDDPRFQREGDDLTLDLTIDLFIAVLGGEVQVPTITGKVTMKINPGAQPGQLIRLRGRGMPRLRDAGSAGDLYVRLNVEVPTDLNARERALFRELASLRGHVVER